MITLSPKLTRHLVKVLYFLSILQHSAVVIAQGDLRWSYFCALGTITCPAGSTVEIEELYYGYSEVCRENRTEPLRPETDCYIKGRSEILQIQQAVCNLTQTCPLFLPSGNPIACPTGTSNFAAVTYTCQYGPTSSTIEPTTEPTTKETTEPTSQEETTSPQTTEGTTAEPTPAPDFTIAIIAGSAAGGAVLLILLGILIAVYRSRGRGTESIDREDKTPPPVSDIKMVNSGSNRVKTAPRIKQDPHRRMDIPLVVYNDSEQAYPYDDPLGLYALPDKTGQQTPEEADDISNPVNGYKISSKKAEDSLVSTLPEDHDTFVDVGSHYAEVDTDNRGRLTDNSFTSGTGSRGSPDGDSQVQEDIAPLRHDEQSSPVKRGDTVSVVYAQVNKPKPDSNDSGSGNTNGDGINSSEPMYSN